MTKVRVKNTFLFSIFVYTLTDRLEGKEAWGPTHQSDLFVGVFSLEFVIRNWDIVKPCYIHTMSMNVFLNKKEEKRNPKCDVSYIGNRSLFIQAPWAATCWTWSGAAQVLKCDKSNCLDAPHGSHKGNPPFLRVSNLE